MKNCKHRSPKLIIIHKPKIPKISDKNKIKFAIYLIFAINGVGVAHAQSVSQSLMPLVRVLQDLAEPVSYGFMVKGFLQVMSGERNEGMKTIKSAIGGFIGIQFIPQIFKIIKGIKL